MTAELLADLPLPQRLAVSYAPAGARRVNTALLALDSRLAAVLRARREPIASQLRLAWWRERLSEPSSAWPRGEPVLDALREWRDPSCLTALPAGWEVLLSEQLTPDVVAQFADGRAQAFVCAAKELGVAHPGAAAPAARIWAVADLAAHVTEGVDRGLVVEYGCNLGAPDLLDRQLRPLAVLARLGRRALARGGEALLSGPGSTLLALRTGLTGR